MASIDKTYIDGKDYILYRNWWIDNYDKMLKERQGYVWLYSFSIFSNRPEEMTPEFLKEHTEDIEYYKTCYDFPIWNTSESWDKWLIKNCDIRSYQERLHEVYSPNWVGFNGTKLKRKNNKPKLIRKRG